VFVLQLNTTQIFWSHHEKIVVVDQSLAFVGGMDMCHGRFDDFRHVLADPPVKLTNPMGGYGAGSTDEEEKPAVEKAALAARKMRDLGYGYTGSGGDGVGDAGGEGGGDAGQEAELVWPGVEYYNPKGDSMWTNGDAGVSKQLRDLEEMKDKAHHLALAEQSRRKSLQPSMDQLAELVKAGKVKPEVYAELEKANGIRAEGEGVVKFKGGRKGGGKEAYKGKGKGEACNEDSEGGYGVDGDGDDDDQGETEAVLLARLNREEEQEDAVWAALQKDLLLQCPQGLDPIVFAALPPELRKDVMEQARAQAVADLTAVRVFAEPLVAEGLSSTMIVSKLEEELGRAVSPEETKLVEELLGGHRGGSEPGDGGGSAGAGVGGSGGPSDAADADDVDEHFISALPLELQDEAREEASSLRLEASSLALARELSQIDATDVAKAPGAPAKEDTESPHDTSNDSLALFNTSQAAECYSFHGSRASRLFDNGDAAAVVADASGVNSTAEEQFVAITVPPGAVAGQVLQVRVESGAVVAVQVPSGTAPGLMFHAKFTLSPPQSNAAATTATQEVPGEVPGESGAGLIKGAGGAGLVKGLVKGLVRGEEEDGADAEKAYNSKGVREERRARYREMLFDLYTQWAPSKVTDIDKLLQKFLDGGDGEDDGDGASAKLATTGDAADDITLNMVVSPADMNASVIYAGMEAVSVGDACAVKRSDGQYRYGRVASKGAANVVMLVDGASLLDGSVLDGTKTLAAAQVVDPQCLRKLDLPPSVSGCAGEGQEISAAQGEDKGEEEGEEEGGETSKGGEKGKGGVAPTAVCDGYGSEFDMLFELERKYPDFFLRRKMQVKKGGMNGGNGGNDMHASISSSGKGIFSMSALYSSTTSSSSGSSSGYPGSCGSSSSMLGGGDQAAMRDLPMAIPIAAATVPPGDRCSRGIVVAGLAGAGLAGAAGPGAGQNKHVLDRRWVPRMPWQDVGMAVTGPAARDVAMHFVQRWNHHRLSMDERQVL
jgi:hypothetical protein